ncbi:MAG: hypothetical protein WC917_02990 [Bacilli bacterium]|jgi:hypothetical protein
MNPTQKKLNEYLIKNTLIELNLDGKSLEIYPNLTIITVLKLGIRKVKLSSNTYNEDSKGISLDITFTDQDINGKDKNHFNLLHYVYTTAQIKEVIRTVKTVICMTPVNYFKGE